jgi:hypothetical protein
MTNNRDDRNINLDYTKKNAKDRAALDLAEQEAVRMHGSIIGNKLKGTERNRIWIEPHTASPGPRSVQTDSYFYRQTGPP